MSGCIMRRIWLRSMGRWWRRIFRAKMAWTARVGGIVLRGIRRGRLATRRGCVCFGQVWLRGRLDGGCISIFVEGLGTAYAPRIEAETILFLEDIGTKPYQWDRMLLHLRYSGLMERVIGIVFGDMGQCVAVEEQELLEKAILHALRDFEGPIGIGLRSGHVSAGNVTLPLGVQVVLDLGDAGNPRMEFLEAAVRVRH